MSGELKLMSDEKLELLRKKAAWARKQLSASGKKSDLCDDVDFLIAHIDAQEATKAAWNRRAELPGELRARVIEELTYFHNYLDIVDYKEHAAKIRALIAELEADNG